MFTKFYSPEIEITTNYRNLTYSCESVHEKTLALTTETEALTHTLHFLKPNEKPQQPHVKDAVEKIKSLQELSGTLQDLIWVLLRMEARNELPVSNHPGGFHTECCFIVG